MTTTRSRGPDRNPDALRLVPGGGAQHPSYLALDRAALGSRTAALSRHLAGCERCRAHVERIAEPIAVPSAVGVERHARRAPVERRRPARRWLNGLAAAATAAVLIIAVLTGRQRTERARPAGGDTPAEAAFDTAKGGRAVGVYVLRGRHTFLWNGSEPVEPGDSIRLKLVPEGMTHVHVFSLSGARELALLHRARIAPDRDSLLDAAWKVDGAGEREVVVVVLSAESLSLARAQAAARDGGMGEDVWVARLVLPKRSATEEVPR